MDIEIRKLLPSELYQLISEAPQSETKFIRSLSKDPYEFFEGCLAINGLIIDGRPIYIAAIMQGKNDRYVFWTVVNSNVKDTITLSKYSKRELNKWVARFRTIYATMGMDNPVNMKWVEWLGFVAVEQDEDTITYKLGA